MFFAFSVNISLPVYSCKISYFFLTAKGLLKKTAKSLLVFILFVYLCPRQNDLGKTLPSSSFFFVLMELMPESAVRSNISGRALQDTRAPALIYAGGRQRRAQTSASFFSYGVFPCFPAVFPLRNASLCFIAACSPCRLRWGPPAWLWSGSNSPCARCPPASSASP